MEICQRLGSNVKRLRLAMGLSQEEFAHRADVHRTYVSDIELGKRNPTVEFGFKPDVLVLSKAELISAIFANPYPEGIEEPKSVHLFFLAEPATKPDLASLDAIKAATERFHLSDEVFYLYAPDGIGRSKLAAQAEQKIGVRVTARNLRSAMKIAELAI